MKYIDKVEYKEGGDITLDSTKEKVEREQLLGK